MLINRCKVVGLKHYNDSKAFMDDNIEECNPNKERKILIVFDDRISEQKTLIKGRSLFIRGRKQNISLAFVAQSCCTRRY